MATLRDDAARWFTLAAEARKLAEGLTDPEAKRKAWRYKLSEVEAMISGKS